MTENALDDALAYLVEAFGHVSEAELQAFLDATPRVQARLTGPASYRGVFDWPVVANAAPAEAFDVAQAARA